MKSVIYKLIVFLALALPIGACGGGGGEGQSSAPDKKNWDQMTWDNDKWS